MAVKLRKPSDVSTDNDALPETTSIPLRPLVVSGVCVTKAALVDALRVYVPNLMDIEVVEDGERFLLTVSLPPLEGN